MVMIRVVFLGTPRFALPTLESLLADETTEVVGVMTQPDRPAGRGQRSQSPPVKAIASDHGIPTLQSHRVKDDPEVMEFFQSTLPDVAVAVAFGQLLPRRVFDFPPHGTLNIHASLLPKYRGAAPIPHALLNGEEVTGVTLMRIEERLDSGPILGQEEIPVGREATSGEIEDLLALRGASLLMRLLVPHVDGQLDLSDVVQMLDVLFGPQTDFPCADACDFDDAGMVDLTDVIQLLQVIFMGGMVAGPDCGPDPTSDALGCGQATICP